MTTNEREVCTWPLRIGETIFHSSWSDSFTDSLTITDIVGDLVHFTYANGSRSSASRSALNPLDSWFYLKKPERKPTGFAAFVQKIEA